MCSCGYACGSAFKSVCVCVHECVFISTACVHKHTPAATPVTVNISSMQKHGLFEPLSPWQNEKEYTMKSVPSSKMLLRTAQVNLCLVNNLPLGLRDNISIHNEFFLVTGFLQSG